MIAEDKKGILLVNLGTPDQPTYSAVHRYLSQFLMDARVIDIPYLARLLLVKGIIAPFRSGKSAQAYKKLWTESGSPIKFHGFALEKKVQHLYDHNTLVKIGMRYQNPSISSALDELIAFGAKEITIFPLFPQYASATTGSVHEEVMSYFKNKFIIPKLNFINSYFQDQPFIDCFVKNGKQHDWKSYDHVLFSFHGLPKRQLRKSDTQSHCFQNEDCCKQISDKNYFCYSAQCFATAQAIAHKLEIPEENYTICYQSRLGRDPWLEPYTSDVLKKRRAAGDKNILVFCPAFVADCLETTIEISEEYAEEFEKIGGEHLQLVESLNQSNQWAEAIVQIIANH